MTMTELTIQKVIPPSERRLFGIIFEGHCQTSTNERENEQLNGALKLPA